MKREDFISTDKLSQKALEALGVSSQGEWDEKVWERVLKSRRAGAAQAEVLIDAGWRFELPEIVNNHPNSDMEPWQWYWRSPAKRKGSKGRFYCSTNQAYRALCRQQGIEPTLPG